MKTLIHNSEALTRYNLSLTLFLYIFKKHLLSRTRQQKTLLCNKRIKIMAVIISAPRLQCREAVLANAFLRALREREKIFDAFIL